MRFAAIDVGTNAVRLMVARVRENGYLRVEKEFMLRIPLRLGGDVFTQQAVGDEKARQLVRTMAAFKNLIEVFSPLAYRACATSAMREATNGAEVVERVRQEAGVDLEVIDGQTEAEIIFSYQLEEELSPETTYLYIDVGGGSTELRLFAGGDVIASNSFPIGGVRLLSHSVPAQSWQELEQWVRRKARPLAPVGIGSGGNIARYHRLAKLSENQPIPRKKLYKIYSELAQLSINERIRTYKLKPDRADIIVPAGQIYHSVMDWGHIDYMYVPKYGLVDGLIKGLYQQYQPPQAAQA